jgi:hypothetical protein
VFPLADSKVPGCATHHDGYHDSLSGCCIDRFCEFVLPASFVAAITTLVYMANYLGKSISVSVLIIPVVAWAKFKLNDHTPFNS